MFGCSFQISYLNNFSNSLIFLEKSFILTFPMAYLAFLYSFYLALVLRARAVTNPFPDTSIFTFDSEDVVSILSRSSNFSEIFKISYIFKVTHLSLPLISFCFLTLRWPVSHVHRLKQILFLTCEIFLPERLPSWATIINRRWYNNY